MIMGGVIVSIEEEGDAVLPELRLHVQTPPAYRFHRRAPAGV